MARPTPPLLYRPGWLIMPALAALLAALALSASPATPAAAQDVAPTATSTPLADARPDGCEPNGDQARACRLPLDAVSGPFTFLPEGDVDVYSVFLGDQPDGLETTVTLRATSGLDLYTTIRRAEDGAPLATIASPTISTTLAADVLGWVVLRVENRGAAIASGQSYRVEVRRTLPPAPSAAPAATGPEGLTRDPAAPDLLENDYSPETAAPVAVGVIYDLNFVCPVAGGCSGGDHDYLRFEVKAGGRYLISTFDLADGVDTALDLFWWSPAEGWQLLASNDDERAGSAFLSTIRWQAPADGVALVRVGPRTGGLNPILSTAPSYRFAIALAGSPLADQLETRIAEQTNAPTPTTAPATAPQAETAGGEADVASPAPAAPTAVSIVSGAATGNALVLAETNAHTDPDASSPTLDTLPIDTLVHLTGRVAGLWVEVEAGAVVGAAWVDRRALRPAEAPAPTTEGAPALSGADVVGLPAALPASPAASPIVGTDSVGLSGQPAAATAAPSLGAAVGPSTAHVSVRLAQGDQPIAGMRILLLTTLDDVLGQQVTADDGSAVFDLQVAGGTRVELVIPALGLRVPVDAAAPDISVKLPIEAD